VILSSAHTLVVCRCGAGVAAGTYPGLLSVGKWDNQCVDVSKCASHDVLGAVETRRGVSKEWPDPCGGPPLAEMGLEVVTDVGEQGVPLR